MFYSDNILVEYVIYILTKMRGPFALEKFCLHAHD